MYAFRVGYYWTTELILKTMMSPNNSHAYIHSEGELKNMLSMQLVKQ
jgi:hypothetical protein